MSKTYNYTYQTREGTRPVSAYSDTNLRRAAKYAREMAKGNCLAGSTATWSVWDASDAVEIKSGTVKA